MKIALAQIKSVSGNISENIKRHILFIKKAIDFKTDIIVFPELSITNYEPTLAKKLATTKNDQRFVIFQQLANENNIIICIGVPIKIEDGITISMLLFQPKKEVLNYAKQLLHKDELPYFIKGKEQVYITFKNQKIAFAICYESMQEEHFINACNRNTSIYIASVAKTEEGIQKGMIHYKSLSEKHQKDVLMVNGIGKSDGFINAEQSVVFKNGKQIAKLEKAKEGLLIFDTNSNDAQTHKALI